MKRSDYARKKKDHSNIKEKYEENKESSRSEIELINEIRKLSWMQKIMKKRER